MISKIFVKKMNKLQKRLKIGVTDLLRYLLAMLPLAYQGMIYAVRTKKVLADSTYKGLWILEFNDKLPANQYMNWNISHIFLSIKIKSSTNEANDVATNMIIVNNFFFPLNEKKLVLSATETIYELYRQITQQRFIGIRIQF